MTGRRRTENGKRRQTKSHDSTWLFLLIGGVILFILAMFLLFFLWGNNDNPFIKKVDPGLSLLLEDARKLT